MVHHCQRLALGLEAGDDGLGVHAELDDLERDATNRSQLVGLRRSFVVYIPTVRGVLHIPPVFSGSWYYNVGITTQRRADVAEAQPPAASTRTSRNNQAREKSQ